MTPPSRPSEIHLRRLSESEIQNQLYGEYRAGDRRRSTQDDEIVTQSAPEPTAARIRRPSNPPPISSTETSPQQEPAWTGAEILKGELDRLGGELQQLDRQRQVIAEKLPRRPAPPLLRAAVVPAPRAELKYSVQVIEEPQVGGGVMVDETDDGDQNRLWTFVIGALIVASAVTAMIFHAVVLEAQLPLPAQPGDQLYSVQAGVYDVKPMAQKFADRLSQEGYHAFLYETKNIKGKPRYRVYVGRYKSKTEAQSELAALRDKALIADSFVLKR